MEWSLLVIRSTNPEPRWFPFELGRIWLAGRYEDPVDAVTRAEYWWGPIYCDRKYYMPLEFERAIHRWHCEFRHENDGAFVRDLLSRTGTFLNGEGISSDKCSLRLDDEIRVGNCKIFVSGTATIDRSWLTWKNGAVVELATEIRETRDFVRLPILGDMLKDAGCMDVDILNHCLDQHQNPQRCCVLDLLLEPQND
jgi:hypothetical protein